MKVWKGSWRMVRAVTQPRLPKVLTLDKSGPRGILRCYHHAELPQWDTGEGLWRGLWEAVAVSWHCLGGCTACLAAAENQGQLPGRQAGHRAEKSKNNLRPIRHLCLCDIELLRAMAAAHSDLPDLMQVLLLVAAQREPQGVARPEKHSLG